MASLVVCSLEVWGPVRRRLQLMVEEIVRLQPDVRVLFVEPALDPAHELRERRLPRWGANGYPTPPNVSLLRPTKWAPRLAGRWVDRSLCEQVLRASARLGLEHPTLWINDVDYADLVPATGWPTVYDVTDDWLAGPMPVRSRRRFVERERTLLEVADEVVVCSPDLARTRGRNRLVHVVSNGLDYEHFSRPRPRPVDLPPPRTAVYAGSLHESRFDIGLCVELARRDRSLNVVLVGPDHLSPAARASLDSEANVHLLGRRDYAEIPGYYQHADVIIVPHQVNAFTDSLDPIKAYESMAVGRPTVATPVAGFRGLGKPVEVAGRDTFADTVLAAVAAGYTARPTPHSLPAWQDQARRMFAILANAGRSPHRVAGCAHSDPSTTGSDS